MPSRRPAVAALLLLITACTTVRPVADPRGYITIKQPAFVTIVRADNRVARVEGPRIIGDTLAGFIDGRYGELPLSAIQRFETSQIHRARSAALVGAIVLGGVLAVVLVGGGGTGEEEEADHIVRWPAGLRP